MKPTKLPHWFKLIPKQYKKRLYDFSSNQVQAQITYYLTKTLDPNPLALKKPNWVKKEAAIIIPLCISDNEPSVLFTVRSTNLRKHGGEVSFPGGLYDDIDLGTKDTKNTNDTLNEILKRTAIRETIEEIPSFKPTDIKILGQMKSVPDKSRTIRVTPFVSFIGAINISNIVYNQSEVSDVFCISFKDLLDERNVGLQSFNERFKDMPYWKGPEVSKELIRDPNGFNGADVNFVKDDGKVLYRVWGLSAYVLSELFSNVLINLE